MPGTSHRIDALRTLVLRVVVNDLLLLSISLVQGWDAALGLRRA